MIIFLWSIALFSLIWPSESALYAQSTGSFYTIHDFIEDYIDMPHTRFRPSDFMNQKETAFYAREFHRSWESEWNHLIYKPPQIPEIKGRLGTFYESGMHYDIYQQKLTTSYDLLVEIENELEEAVKIACKICCCKQRIELQTCPAECYGPPT